jgi:hypothetical protein
MFFIVTQDAKKLVHLRLIGNCQLIEELLSGVSAIAVAGKRDPEHLPVKCQPSFDAQSSSPEY